jgi:sugar O-acyltransferase (sialic acid O-acetyltransferase NeuD family)
MKKLLIVGTGGLARELTNWCAEKFEIIGYFSISKDEHAKFKLPGKLFTGELTPKATGAECALIAIGSPEAKKRYFSQLKESGFTFPSFVHSSSTVSKSAEVGEGTVIAPQCVIGPNTKLGQAVYVNFQVGIGHDAQIGDFVQINPGAQIGGLVTVGNSVLIGSGSTILETLSVGNNAIVGSGSSCFARVPENVTVIGNPAKRMRAFE